MHHDSIKLSKLLGKNAAAHYISIIMGITLIGCNGGSSSSGSNNSTATSLNTVAATENASLPGDHAHSKSAVGTSTTESTAGYTIFVTHASYTGDFLKYNNTGDNSLNSTEVADSLCNEDYNRPNTKVYHALIGSSNRYACDVSGVCGNGHSKDWPLKSNTKYVDIYGDTIFKTDNKAIFTFGTLNTYFSTLETYTWTGLTSTWKVDSQTCGDWQSHSNDHTGRIGYTVDYTSGSISKQNGNCHNEKPLYCVQQPDTTVSPEEGSVSVPVDTGVTVTYTDAINPLTVSNDTFTLTAGNGVLVDGTVTVGSDNKSVTFKSESNLSGETTYTIKLVNIQYENGELAQDFTSTFTTVSSSSLLIFTSTNSYYGQNLGSKTDIDDMCTAEAESIATGTHKEEKSYKAMLTYNNSRLAIPNLDWVLQPNQTYVNTSDEVIGKTNESAVFGGVLEHSILPSVKRVWTGLNSDWTIAISDNCNDWKDNKSHGFTGTTYNYETDTGNVIMNSEEKCGNTTDSWGEVHQASKGHVYCVEQSS